MNDKNLEISTPERILEKIKTSLGIVKGKDLAKVFNVRNNTVSSWKIRKSLPYLSIIEVCNEYGLNLNEIFYENYTNQLEEGVNYVKIPIVFLNDYWSYYFDPKFIKTRLQYFIFSKALVDFDIIIQLSKGCFNLKSKNELVYMLCKKVLLLEELNVRKPYVVVIKNRGIIYCSLVEIDFDIQKMEIKLPDDDYLTVKFDKVIEIFSCQGEYYNVI